MTVPHYNGFDRYWITESLDQLLIDEHAHSNYEDDQEMIKALLMKTEHTGTYEMTPTLFYMLQHTEEPGFTNEFYNYLVSRIKALGFFDS